MLYAEDNLMLLETEGYACAAYSGAEAFLKEDMYTVPGCMVLDIAMPGMSGLELQNEMKRRGIDMPVLFLTAHGDLPVAVNTMKKGAVDFLQKPFDEETFLKAVRRALSLDVLIRHGFPSEESLRRTLNALRESEKAVLHYLIGEKLPNKTIAARLSIAERTVETHRATVYRKCNVHNAEELQELLGVLGEQPFSGAPVRSAV